MLICVIYKNFSISISHTSAGADVVIVGGDLNMHPQDLGNRLLRAYTDLRDSYLDTAKFDVGTDKKSNMIHTVSILTKLWIPSKTVALFLLQGCEDGMTLIADNPFISKKEIVPFEKGIRIDYILFKVEENICFIIHISYIQSYLLQYNI